MGNRHELVYDDDKLLAIFFGEMQHTFFVTQACMEQQLCSTFLQGRGCS